MSDDARPMPTVRENTDASRYEISFGRELAGYTEYERRGETYALIHTEIHSRFEGKGLASTLTAHVLDDLGARRIPVLPYCPFVRSYLTKHPEYVALVPADRRERFGLPLDRPPATEGTVSAG